MKKNISVNIFGTLYPIDEDAYELLQKYNDNMRRYYSQREGGDEIADDVEHRVAELLSELRANGTEAITIEHIKEIIDRIGDPQAMDDGDSENTETGQNVKNNAYGNPVNQNINETPEVAPSNRKLFRDPEDKIVGGVMSGISHYFGLNEPLLLRLAMVLLLIASLTTFGIIYLVAWILIPEAITPEDRLRMYGKPVSAKAINEEMMRGLNNTRDFMRSTSTRNTIREVFSVIVKIILFLIAIFFALILGSLLIALLAAVFGLSVASIVGATDIGASDPDLSLIHTVISSVPTYQWILLGISAILILGVPLFSLGRVIFKRNNDSMSTGTKLVLVLIWLFSLCLFTGMAITAAKSIHSEATSLEKKNNTRNGIYLPETSWRALDNLGWNLTSFEGIDKWISEWGELPSGEEGDYISLEAKKSPNQMNYTLMQVQELIPGSYKIEADVRSDGSGNSLFVITTENDTIRFSIPPMSRTEKADEKTMTASEDSISETEEAVEETNTWDHVSGVFEVKKQGAVKYGLSNESKLSGTPKNSRKIEIANVTIEKQ